jgi:hypothetical protein
MRFSAIFNQVYTILILFCRKGDKQQNISFSGEARRWLCCTYNKCFERWGIPHVLVILKDGVGICLHIIEDRWVNDSLHITIQLKFFTNGDLSSTGFMIIIGLKRTIHV